MSTAAEWIDYAIEDETLTYNDLARLIQHAQRSLGVVPDGRPGPRTLEALRRHLEAVGDVADLDAHAGLKAFVGGVPKGRAAGHRLYGLPSWTRPDPTKRRVTLDRKWVGENIRRYELCNGDYVNLHKLVGPEFQRLFEQACRVSSYEPSTQSWNPRTIGLSNRLSWHAVGAAVDVNPARNGWGDRDAEILKHEAWIAVFESAGWTWGGRWDGGDGAGDNMHLQRVQI